MTTLAEIVASLRPGETPDTWDATIPDDWLQGRTSYGGLSSALALWCAKRVDADLPPLRSAQIAFVGPLSGAVRISAQRLRRGRNAAFVQADVSGADGLGLRCTFLFMQALPSSVRHDAPSAAGVAPPGVADTVLRGHPGIAFTHRFEMVDRATDDPAAWRRWVRLAARDALDPAVELLAIADALPPAAAKLLAQPAPMSSLTWMVNLLDPAPRTDEGWWLLQSRADHARDGHSSQAMQVWNAAGQKVAEQMQSVAIFG